MKFFQNCLCEAKRVKILEDFRQSYETIYSSFPCTIQPIREEVEKTIVGRFPEARYVMFVSDKYKNIQVNDEIYTQDKEYIVLERRDWGKYIELYLKEKK